MLSVHLLLYVISQALDAHGQAQAALRAELIPEDSSNIPRIAESYEKWATASSSQLQERIPSHSPIGLTENLRRYYQPIFRSESDIGLNLETDRVLSKSESNSLSVHKPKSKSLQKSKKAKFGFEFQPRPWFPSPQQQPMWGRGMDCLEDMSCAPSSFIRATSLSPHLKSPLMLMITPQCPMKCMPHCLPECYFSDDFDGFFGPSPFIGHGGGYPILNPLPQQPSCRTDCMPMCSLDCVQMPPAIIRCGGYLNLCQCAPGYMQCTPFTCCIRYQSMAKRFRSEIRNWYDDSAQQIHEVNSTTVPSIETSTLTYLVTGIPSGIEETTTMKPSESGDQNGEEADIFHRILYRMMSSPSKRNDDYHNPRMDQIQLQERLDSVGNEKRLKSRR